MPPATDSGLTAKPAAHALRAPAVQAPTAGGALREIGARIRFRWLVKGTANTLGLTAFFIAYFWVQGHPLTEPVQMPLTWLDRQIAFMPAAIVPYVSLWLYLSVPLALLGRRDEVNAFLVSAFALAVIGLTIFLVWPTATPYGMDEGILRGVDGNGNACPSLHAAFAVFAAAWLHDLAHPLTHRRGWQWANALWCTAILYSTLATRQHVVWDVVAGSALGAVVVGIALRGLRRPRAR